MKYLTAIIWGNINAKKRKFLSSAPLWRSQSLLNKNKMNREAPLSMGFPRQEN